MNLSIKNVPDDVVDRLRLRAKRNHRSLQGELAAIVEAAARDVVAKQMDIREVWAEVQKMGLRSPSESTAMIRADRDRDEGR